MHVSRGIIVTFLHLLSPLFKFWPNTLGNFQWNIEDVAKAITCMIMSGPCLTGYTQVSFTSLTFFQFSLGKKINNTIKFSIFCPFWSSRHSMTGTIEILMQLMNRTVPFLLEQYLKMRFVQYFLLAKNCIYILFV